MSAISRGESVAEYREMERRKSNLLLTGRLARELGQEDEAARVFGEAAALEEALAAAYAHLPEKSVVHRASAASCWSQAGNFLRALELCDALAQDESTPETLRANVQSYAKTLRERRHRLWSEMLTEPLNAA